MWVAFALGSALVTAVFTTITKAGLGKVEATVALAVQSVLSLTVAWGVVAYRGQFGVVAGLDARSWGLLVLAGTMSGMGSLLLFLALNSGPASQVVPVDRASFVFAAVLAAVFLGEKIDLRLGIGLGLMAAGVAVIALGAEAPEAAS